MGLVNFPPPGHATTRGVSDVCVWLNASGALPVFLGEMVFKGRSGGVRRLKKQSSAGSPARASPLIKYANVPLLYFDVG